MMHFSVFSVFLDLIFCRKYLKKFTSIFNLLHCLMKFLSGLLSNKRALIPCAPTIWSFVKINFDYFRRKCKTRTSMKPCLWCQFDTNYIFLCVLLLLFNCKTYHCDITLGSCNFLSTAG